MSSIRHMRLADFWADAPKSSQCFEVESISHLPELAQRYLLRMIKPGTLLSTAARLCMTGEIRLGERWLPFDAEQVLRLDRGFIWAASVKRFPMSIRGSDRFIDHEGSMSWRLFNMIPVVEVDGPNISRSAFDRFALESAIWLPSILLQDATRWEAHSESSLSVSFRFHDRPLSVELTVAEDGRLERAQMRRWGNPDNGEFIEEDFGGVFERDSAFAGYRVPTSLRVGWRPYETTFRDGGEFWRAEVNSIEYI